MKKTRKAFTLVELLVVIAILAVLATVGIVGYTSFTKKAKESNDRTVISQLNLALQASETTDGKPKTMYEALKVVESAGFVVANLTPDSDGYDYVYDMKNNRFALLNKTAVVAEASDKSFVDGVTAWQFVDAGKPLSTSRSNYLKDGWTGDVPSTSTGLDCGNNTGITSVTYSHTGTAQDVVIRTNGDQCQLSINGPQDNIDFYGYAKSITVSEVASSSLHIYGAVNDLSVAKGHVEIENTGIVFNVSTLDTTDATNPGKITNKGYIAAASTEEIKAAVEATTGSKTVGGDYEISSLEQFEAFRDAVNSGNNFAGKTVKLVKDITLKDGWRPIGEGYRDVAHTNTVAFGITTFFSGTFDGQNHTISNLNNKNFKPTQARLVKDGTVDTYAYGLFALVENATFKNVKLTGVDIDGSRYQNANIDSVAALVGYSRGNLTVENVTVSGTIKATDAVSGVVGRINTGANTIVITGCTNNANITAEVVASGIARIYKGQAGHSVTLTNNTNSGTISSLSPKNIYGGICVFTQGNITNFTQSNNTNKGNEVTISVTGDSGESRLD